MDSSDLPKYKIPKDYLKKLSDEKKRTKASSDPFETTMTHQKEIVGPVGPRKMEQHCMNCGTKSVFRIDSQGWKYCMKCGAQAPDRSQIPG